ncbi:MAG: hypothetical protein DRP56_07205 [Planctomycetota bacterium]|nr:MAG: hypothetical protein DRP56_07205 [Planctomycetota bacterium]
MTGSEYLFTKDGLFDLPRSYEASMKAEIESLDGNKILNTSTDDLVDYYYEYVHVKIPVLDEDNIQVEQKEATIDVTGDSFRFNPSGEPLCVKGTIISYHIPFEGEGSFFRLQPSSYSFSPPRGTIYHNELILSYTFEKSSPEEISSKFNSQLAEIKEYLENLRSDFEPFNGKIKGIAKKHIEARKEKLLADQGIVASLGFPIRKRHGAPETYVAPVARKQAKVVFPTPSSEPFSPEPVLEMREYENILKIMSSMVMVMEKSPHAFKDMREEDLRQHFLVQLNAQYEGQATGETFNYEGKTDILIKENDKNVFVAECKFWRGPKQFTETIDQLLGYLTWRDTKTAILLFNRNKNFSDVLGQIPDLMKQHPNFKREQTSISETGFRYALHNRDDVNRELILTVLCFDVPR